MTTTSVNEHTQALELPDPETGVLAEWTYQIRESQTRIEGYRVKALTGRNLEDLCRLIYRHIKWEAGKYEGSRLTEDIAIDMTTEVVTTLEMLRLAMITLAEHRGEPTDRLRGLDLSGVTGYFKRHIGETA